MNFIIKSNLMEKDDPFVPLERIQRTMHRRVHQVRFYKITNFQHTCFDNVVMDTHWLRKAKLDTST